MKYVLLPTVLILLTFLCIIIAQLQVSNVSAAATSPVNATVKIGICGNGIVEGGEDCDGSELQGRTCASFGYSGGTLQCDIACEVNLSECTGVTPTPLPGSDPTPTMSSSTNPSISSTPSLLSPTPLRRQADIITTPALPPTLQQFFQLNGFKLERVTVSDIPVVVKGWVDAWRELTKNSEQETSQRCDINGDTSCDLRDFSVLMSYVQR